MFKATPSSIKLWGNLAWGLGVFDFVADHVIRFSNYSYVSYWQSYSPARGMAVSALILVGIIALYVGRCLEKFEQRLSKLEEEKIGDSRVNL